MDNQRRYRTLVGNIILFLISSFGSKIIFFVLVPLYTNYLSTADYGTVDLINTVVALIVPTFTLGMSDSVLKYSIEDNEHRKSILDISFLIIVVDTIVLLCAILVIAKLDLFQLSSLYYAYLLLNFTFNALYNILCNYLKSFDSVKLIMQAGIINSIITCVLNLIFLVGCEMGVKGYLFGTMLGSAISVFYLFFNMAHKKLYHFAIRKINIDILKRMLRYGIPLIFNGISWWINNSLDRLLITVELGIAANGIYAVSYKIPSVLSVLQSVFNQAWTISAIQEKNSSDKNKFYSLTYSVYECGFAIICCLLIIANVPLAKPLYAKDFFEAWHYTPPLLIASLANAMSIYMSSIFCAVGNTTVLSATTLIGAFINLLLNLLLIPKIGLIGAAVATAISNIIIWIIRRAYAKKYVTLITNVRREVATIILLTMQTILGEMENHLYIFQLLILCIIFSLYKVEVRIFITFCGQIAKKLINRVKV